MFRGSRSRARIALLMAMSALASLAVGQSPSGAAGATAASPHASAPSFVGPLISRAENAVTSWGRDGGFSVPLPGGRDFWIFGDTPRYQYQSGRWRLTYFIYGSSAGVQSFSTGKKPSSAFYEVQPGKKVLGSNQPVQFLPS